MITTTNHPNSRIVTIFRKASFAENAQAATAYEFISMAKQSIGSYWENSFSKTIGSGLNFTEQKLLMPTLVDCEPEDRNFRKKVSEYFSSIKTTVPFKKGRQLEIGLEKSNSKPVSEDNLPLNLADYITYRHALNHPQVAKNRADAEGNMLKNFYVFDPVEEDEGAAKENTMRDEALELYLKIRKQPEKMDMLLTLLGMDPRKYTGKNAESRKGEELKKVAQSNPKKFTSTYEDKFFEQQYVIQTLINTGILSKAGELIINPDTGETLGHNMLEAVAWLKDKANSDKVVLLKARMQESLQSAPALQKAAK